MKPLSRSIVFIWILCNLCDLILQFETFGRKGSNVDFWEWISVRVFFLFKLKMQLKDWNDHKCIFCIYLFIWNCWLNVDNAINTSAFFCQEKKGKKKGGLDFVRNKPHVLNMHHCHWLDSSQVDKQVSGETKLRGGTSSATSSIPGHLRSSLCEVSKNTVAHKCVVIGSYT